MTDVSVIMPFLDPSDGFFRDAVNSVLSQTCRDWELLLVNDGSGERSSQLARSFTGDHGDRVRYLQYEMHENRGLVAARAFGIVHARGRNVAFLDADDIWLPQKLEKHLELLERLPSVGAVYGMTRWWFSWTGRDEDLARDFVPEAGLPVGQTFDPPFLVSAVLLGRATVPCICSVVARREAILTTGEFADLRGDIYEDQVLLTKLFLRHPVYVADGAWELYRQHDDAMTARRQEEQRRADRARFLAWMRVYLASEDARDSEVRRALRAAEWRLGHPRAARLQRLSLKLVDRVRRRIAPGRLPLVPARIPVSVHGAGKGP